ncbi:16071_t:CDS:2 [Entrophospora sp. SA101]|nr:16071_t:CDS:2 [Entrophospora sp. SA101]
MNGENPSQFVFFAPIIMTPSEPPKRPNVPESIMKKLPIVKITKEHVDSLATCSICLEHFHIQDNTCPLCRYELPSEEQQQQQESNNINDIATNNHDSNESSESTNVPLSNMNEGLPTLSSTSSLNHSNLVGSLSSTIITLPQCHHRFHASCLRNTLLISGYSLESNSLDFRCPICRAPPLIIHFNDEMDLD